MQLNQKEFNNKDLKSKLNELYSRVETLADMVYKSVIKISPEYAGSFNVLIGKPFLKTTNDTSSFRRLNLNYLNKLKEKKLEESFNEQFSDECYSIMLDNLDICKTNDECLAYYTNPAASGYFLTHQVLFYLISDGVS